MCGVMPWWGIVRHGWSLRRRLREPHVARVSGELAALQRPHDGVAIADFAARGVHDVGAALHLGDELVVEEVLGLWMQRRVDRHHVADLHERLHVRVEREAKLLLNLWAGGDDRCNAASRRTALGAAARQGRCGRRRRCRRSCLPDRRSARRSRRCSSRRCTTQP